MHSFTCYGPLISQLLINRFPMGFRKIRCGLKLIELLGKESVSEDAQHRPRNIHNLAFRKSKENQSSGISSRILSSLFLYLAYGTAPFSLGWLWMPQVLPYPPKYTVLKIINLRHFI